MVRIREEFDADRAENAIHVSNYPTEKTQYEVYCDMCGEVYFVGGIIFEKVSSALREGYDNPFICDDCRDELGESAYL